ncbi:MAG TPA: Asp-tRNA(Asn)/Glu-tRNA(Gln) amidotransferase subunit GatC [Caldithrix abyssi]|uniref:Aspartyl/glutamyl-tRNA(Asn/Gln) amidotransferase subunit C n=1 Tax=Caldithrix abyssi TaxID=187145 RepID=A0A7V5RN10_CALAY|nr:Asp-tRNA(Asn)/Glu-tRNA(Gln) amidotransferase subunit GatC [Caldithrix abyssi]
MSVSREDIKKIARLAQLHIEEEQYDQYMRQLNAILGYMEKLNALDTNDVTPLMHSQELQNVMREDTVRRSLTQEEALKNAPGAGNGFFRVPKVVKR